MSYRGSYGKMINTLFNLIRRYEKANEDINNPYRTSKYIKSRRKVIDKMANEISDIIRYLLENVENFRKINIISLLTKYPEMFMEYMREKYDMYVWKDTIEKFVYTKIISNVDFHIITKVHKMQKKYLEWLVNIVE